MDYEELGLTNGSETSVDSVELTDETPAPYFYEILEGLSSEPYPTVEPLKST
jgi:hypothetical protein